MTKRTHVANQLAAYFEEKGKILNPVEYKKEKDTPVRFALVKKTFGSWNRMENIVRGFNIRNQLRSEQPRTSDVDEVIRRNAEVEAEYAEKMKAASENLEAKTAREAAAQAYVEADKLRAATAEGAAENKMRKGGVTFQDAKAQKEAVEQAVAEEHKMLAKSGPGAALGKHLLGGVEDNDEKTRVIAEQNAFREKAKLMAATPLGAAEAKLMEDDTDGQLTREAQARLRNELRPYVPPVTEGAADQALKTGQAKVRDEVRSVVEEAKGDEDVLTDSVFRASLARARHAGQLNDPVDVTEIPEEVVATMPPADQPPADDFDRSPTEFKNKDGEVVARVDDEENPDEEETLTDGVTAKAEKRTDSAKEAMKLSAGEKEANKNNPHAPPATRNPDPKVAPTADPKSGDKKQNNDGAKATPAKTAAPKSAPKGKK
jgi:hypothetical protein